MMMPIGLAECRLMISLVQCGARQNSLPIESVHRGEAVNMQSRIDCGVTLAIARSAKDEIVLLLLHVASPWSAGVG
jgi:hypothetical protein